MKIEAKGTEISPKKFASVDIKIGGNKVDKVDVVGFQFTHMGIMPRLELVVNDKNGSIVLFDDDAIALAQELLRGMNE